MKHNTFDPCKDHENGHFGRCLLCEIEQLRKRVKMLDSDLDRMTKLSWEFEKCCPHDKWILITEKFGEY